MLLIKPGLKLFFVLLGTLQYSFFCHSQANSGVNIKLSETFELVPLGNGIFMHVSHDEHPGFGKFTSNGLLFISGNEAVFADTPPTGHQAKLLLTWLYNTYPQVKPVAVLVNHFHADCLGGLSEFHKAGIKSYSHRLTPQLLPDSLVSPTHFFTEELTLKAGNATIVARYFGEAHTRDNIVVWLPEEKILFGGCMVKSLGSGRGNIADANLTEWSATVKKVKKAYQKAKIVIPGHGAAGGPDLLDYTIQMFASKAGRKK